MSPKEDGSMEMAYVLLGKLLFVPLKGSLWSGAKWIPAKAMVEDFNMEFIPSAETGEFEAAVHEYYSNGMRDSEYAPFDECAAAAGKEFAEYCEGFPAAPQAYAEMARLAAWTIWTHTILPGGNIKNPVVYMSRTYLIRAYGWQQSYQAMARRGKMREAWELLLTMFDYQDSAGQLPDSVGEMGIGYRVSKPIIQGLALNYLLGGGDAAGGSRGDAADEISPEDCAGLYDKLSRFTDWWLTMRDHEKSGIPKYYHPDESGWDDATVFKKGVPLISCDLLAWLVLASEACAALAKKAGMPDGDATRWEDESKRLLNLLIKELWNGKRFVCRVAETGEVVEEDSAVALQPIILGNRLPADIVDAIAEQLEDGNGFLTRGGVVSEKLDSPEFTIRRGFMKGNIVAPMQLLLALGLKDAGKADLARDIATRYCNLVCEKGFSLMLSPWEYDPSTGLAMNKEDIYDPDDWDKAPDIYKCEKKEDETVELWSSWTAACFLTLLSGVMEA
ncbi:MAG: hypothetical protein FWH00_04665 [Oscillospiraceae bacterium]|nr:hypothetical protein [Oscillospiraceae bacterium]